MQAASARCRLLRTPGEHRGAIHGSHEGRSNPRVADACFLKYVHAFLLSMFIIPEVRPGIFRDPFPDQKEPALSVEISVSELLQGAEARLISSPVLTLPRDDGDYIIDTDASDAAVLCCVVPFQDSEE